METKGGWKSYDLCHRSKLFSIEKMINLIIKLVQSNEWYGISKEVEIAKGKDQYVHTFKQLKRTLKRKYHGRRN